MNINRQKLLFVFCAIFAAATTCFAQKQVIAGGYAPVEADNADVVAAAKFAVRTEAKKSRATIKLVKVKQAESQVVAGQNFRLCLEVTVKPRGKKDAATKNVQAVVYRNLKQKLSLTSWEEAVCIQLTAQAP